MFCCLYSAHGEIDVHAHVLIRAYGNDRRFATASSNKKVTSGIFWQKTESFINIIFFQNTEYDRIG